MSNNVVLGSTLTEASEYIRTHEIDACPASIHQHPGAHQGSVVDTLYVLPSVNSATPALTHLMWVAAKTKDGEVIFL